MSIPSWYPLETSCCNVDVRFKSSKDNISDSEDDEEKEETKPEPKKVVRKRIKAVKRVAAS